MSRVTFNGKPGTTWTNDGPKVQYQLLVDWHNSCGLCAQYDHAVGPIWPTPFHRGCRCRQKPIWPGESAAPFVDFRAKIAELDRTQQSRVVGRANLDLIESGVLQWDDVVTSNRVRTLREVVSREKLSIDAMVKAGVQRGQAERTFEAVHTPAHQLAEDARRAALKHLADLGVGKAEVREHFGEAMASRVTIAAGPSQRPPGWNGGLFVGPKPPPLTPAAVAAALGVTLKPPSLTFTRAETESVGYATVLVDVANLDAELAKDQGFYVGPGGTAAAIVGRYEEFGRFAAKAEKEGIAIEQPRMGLDVAGQGFIGNGRHRWAWLRDRGFRSIPVSVPKEQAAAFRARYGFDPKDKVR